MYPQSNIDCEEEWSIGHKGDSRQVLSWSYEQGRRLAGTNAIMNSLTKALILSIFL